MLWLPVHTSLPRHMKLKRFSRLLNIKQVQAVGHLVMLWLWTLEVAPKGSLSDFTDAEIADGAGWRGRDKGSFIYALIEAGFMDCDYRIHDWEDYAGDLLDRREKERLRKQEQRLKQRQKREKMDADIETQNWIESLGHPL